MSRYGRGLAVKMAGYRGAASASGFIMSKAELARLDALKEAMNLTSKTVRRTGNLLSAGLGAVALGLVANGLAKRSSR